MQANIFFFITSVAVIIFTIFLCVVLYYVIRILRAIRNIIDRVDAGSETIAEDIANLRSYVKEGGLFSSIVGLFSGKKGGRRRSDD